ncbi:MAG: HATPase-c-5 domain-containing protein [Enterococcus gilvus]|jgi:hypothetical protein
MKGCSTIIFRAGKDRDFRSPKKTHLLLIILVILTTFSLTTFKITSEIKKTNVTTLNERWTFIVKDHSDHYIFGKTEQRLKNVHPNNPLVMQQHLETKLKDPQLVVRTNHQWLSVFVGETLIYKYSATDAQTEPGLLQTTIRLPHDYYQQKLRIVTKTPYEYYAGIPAQVFIGEAAKVNRFFILRSLPQFLLLIVCSLLIALLVALFLSKPKESKKASIGSLLLIGFTLLVGMQSLVLNVPASTLLGPRVSSILYNLTSILIPVFLTNYYLLRTKKYHHYYLYGVGSQVFLLVFGLCCLAMGKLSLPIAVQIFSGFNVFMTLYTSAIALAESADHNRFYTICSPGIIMAAFIHCFFYIQLFAGAANLTTDWPLILFSGLMLLIAGYQVEEDLAFIKQQRLLQQESLQQQLKATEKQKNLLATFKLLAEKEAESSDQPVGLSPLLQQMRDYYHGEFQRQAKFFSCQLTVDREAALLEDDDLFLFIQLFEKFLKETSFGTIDIIIRQEHTQLIIESNTSAFTRHSFDESVETAPTNDSHHELEQAVLRSNGEWHWQSNEKRQYFKIILAL